MVGGSSMFALSAVAVDKDMVGRDRDGELIELWLRWAAAKRAAVAVCGSLLLGEVVKY